MSSPRYVRLSSLTPPRVRLESLTYTNEPTMEKEYIDRARTIREGILQLRDSL
jgi:hypothetical protein